MVGHASSKNRLSNTAALYRKWCIRVGGAPPGATRRGSGDGDAGDGRVRLHRGATHYGVYKVANEETARVYWEEHKIPSIAFRPLTVYGPGRDFGLTADPTLAMKAAVLGRPFQIRWGGATDFVFADDVARACVAASTATLDGARVYNLHGESVTVADLTCLIEEAWPSAKGTVTYVDQPVPFPSESADAGYPRDPGPAPRTGIRDGIRRTLDEFDALKKAGRLDARELESAP